MKRPTPLTDKFIDDLKQSLDRSGTQQGELARKIGVTKQLLWKWFKRTTNPDSENVLKLESYLKEREENGFAILISLILTGAMCAVFIWAFVS